MSLARLRSMSRLGCSMRFKESYSKALKKKAEEDAQERREALLEKRIEATAYQREYFQKNISSESQAIENLTTDDNAVSVGHISPNNAAHSGSETMMYLDNFFKRPVFLQEFVIDGLQTDVSFNPFISWTGDATIRAKLSNYAFFRGDMVVRIVLSSTKFQYGSLLVSFQPYASVNPILKALESHALNESAYEPYFNYLSQSPEKTLIQFGDDSSVEMRLPMIIPKQTLHLSNKGGGLITNAVNFEEFSVLGDLYLTTLNKLQLASSNTSADITVQIYGWMENVELGPITAADIDIVAESQPVEESKFDKFRSSVNNNKVLTSIAEAVEGQADDEYTDSGPATKIASAVSNMTNQLSSIPYVGLAAKATSMAAGAGAKVLNFFGFSKPSNIDPLIFVKNLPFSNFAHISGKDTAYKLTADPKQELSVELMGGEANMDPMAIRFMTARETYLNKVVWSTNDTVRSTALVTLPISPTLSTFSFNGLSNKLVQLTSLGNAAFPFLHWRGTMSFRFEVIASAFHKGKLMFVYEPTGRSLDLILAKPQKLNQQYIHYLDLAESREITIDVGFVHDRLFANVFPENNNTFNGAYGTVRNTAGNKTFYDEGRSIGSLYVLPFTTLVAPEAEATVDINMYVYSDDMEFAVPRNIDNDTDLTRRMIVSESVPESSPGQVSNFVTGTRTQGNRCLINKIRPSSDKSFLYHFGEKIDSFRALLNRSHTTYDFGTEDDVINISSRPMRIPIYPTTHPDYYPSRSPTPAVDLKLDDKATFSLFEHLRTSYLFCKGGYRYQLLDYTNNSIDVIHPTYYTITRKRSSIEDQNIAYFAVENIKRPSLEGSIVFDRQTNGGIEFEIPFFSTDLFIPTCGYVNPSLYGNLISTRVSSAWVEADHAAPIVGARVILSGSSAEDFTFFRYQGAGFYCVPV